ncbi:MAG: hypothetical protein IJ499_05300 [Clostridia bacterium]|nr:hypothetical protein [Clostridia bacterium]
MGNLFKRNNEAQTVSPKALYESKYVAARHNLLLVVAFTTINLILLVAKSYTYFLFSAFVPYFLTDLGMWLGGMYPPEAYMGEMEGVAVFGTSFFIATVVISVIIIAMYLLSWIFSKKNKSGWLVFSLVLFSIDTVCMFLLGGLSADSIIDVLFHVWVIWYLASGIIACNKLKKLPCDVIEAEGEEIAEETEEEIENTEE